MNKRHGISVHGGTNNRVGLIDLVRKKFGENFDLCHRLDKNTTGCLVFGKNKKAVKHFNKTVSNNDVTKTYTAILKGKLKKLILNNCGHNPLIDKPKESINKIKEFINKIENK